MTGVRVVYALVVTAVAVWLLAEGLPFGAIAVVVLAVWARRAAGRGRLGRFGSRFANRS